MKKSLLAFAVLAATSASANEGMWMPQQLPQIARQLKAAGLKLDPHSLTRLTGLPAGAIVSLGGCSASFVSPQGLVVTNHHCVYNSVAQNSTPERNLLADGFVARAFAEEVPAAPGTRVFVTKEVVNVTDKVVTPAVAKLTGKARSNAIQKNQKMLIAACEQDPGHRCTVPSFYGGLEFHLIKQLEIRDVRLVHVPPEGVGKFGGETDNWMWPRHTGDYGFYRAYVGKDGKAADYSEDNVPYVPQHYLKLAQEGVKEGDFVMAMGYPGRTNRHRLPSEVRFTFDWFYPAYLKASADNLAIIARETKDNEDLALKYAGQVGGINSNYKNRQAMIDSYANSDLLQRKTAEHEQLKAWVSLDAKRKTEYADDIARVEQLIAARDAGVKRDFNYNYAQPRLLTTARTLYRLANESQKPDAERKSGYQVDDLPRLKSNVAALVRTFDPKVDKAIAMHHLKNYLAQPANEQKAAFNQALGIRTGMSDAELSAALDKLYAGTNLTDADERNAWLDKKPGEFQASGDPFIKAAVALYDTDLRKEAEEEELAGDLQQAYGGYMKAKIAYLKSKGRAVYPDANNTLRFTYGHVAGRPNGADGTAWTAFTTVNGVVAKATGKGEFNAPKAQLDAIRARDFGKFVDPKLKTVPVNFLATLDIIGGNSGSAALNAKGELVGLVFDGTLDSIIADWDFNDANTRDIQVDLRCILWNMKHVDKADNLLKEMGAE